ncbi:MAG: hypothetical protein ABF479_02180 [Gluconacetobacter sp.]
MITLIVLLLIGFFILWPIVTALLSLLGWLVIILFTPFLWFGLWVCEKLGLPHRSP